MPKDRAAEPTADLPNNSNEQYRRFIEAARELGTDDDPERFKETVRKLAKAPVARNAPSKAGKRKPNGE